MRDARLDGPPRQRGVRGVCLLRRGRVLQREALAAGQLELRVGEHHRGAGGDVDLLGVDATVAHAADYVAAGHEREAQLLAAGRRLHHRDAAAEIDHLHGVRLRDLEGAGAGRHLGEHDVLTPAQLHVEARMLRGGGHPRAVAHGALLRVLEDLLERDVAIAALVGGAEEPCRDVVREEGALHRAGLVRVLEARARGEERGAFGGDVHEVDGVERRSHSEALRVRPTSAAARVEDGDAHARRGARDAVAKVGEGEGLTVRKHLLAVGVARIVEDEQRVRPGGLQLLRRAVEGREDVRGVRLEQGLHVGLREAPHAHEHVRHQLRVALRSAHSAAAGARAPARSRPRSPRRAASAADRRRRGA